MRRYDLSFQKILIGGEGASGVALLNGSRGDFSSRTSTLTDFADFHERWSYCFHTSC